MYELSIYQYDDIVVENEREVTGKSASRDRFERGSEVGSGKQGRRKSCVSIHGPQRVAGLYPKLAIHSRSQLLMLVLSLSSSTPPRLIYFLQKRANRLLTIHSPSCYCIYQEYRCSVEN